MRVGILGAGTMGSALGRAAARAGHDVRFGSRFPDSAARAARDAGHGASAGTRRDAVRHGELVILATRWQQVFEAIAEAGPWADRLVLDATNPSTPDGRALLIGHTTSGAEEIARAIPEAQIVKAFHHVYAELLEEAAVGGFPGLRPAAFYCGDHPDANAAAARLAGDLGFDPVYAGALRVARYLEPAAQLMVELVEGVGHGPASVALALACREVCPPPGP